MYMFQIFLLLHFAPFFISSLPQQTFLAPLNDANVAASQVIFSRGSHNQHINKEVTFLDEINNYDEDSSEQEKFIFSPGDIIIDSEENSSASPSEHVKEYVNPDEFISSSIGDHSGINSEFEALEDNQ